MVADAVEEEEVIVKLNLYFSSDSDTNSDVWFLFHTTKQFSSISGCPTIQLIPDTICWEIASCSTG